jgi:hypothetical protein
MKSITQYYRSLPAEVKAFLAIANKEVGLGLTLELLAHLSGRPSNIPRSELVELRELAKARNLRLAL